MKYKQPRTSKDAALNNYYKRDAVSIDWSKRFINYLCASNKLFCYVSGMVLMSEKQQRQCLVRKEVLKPTIRGRFILYENN